jgi:hypothetical protein
MENDCLEDRAIQKKILPALILSTEGISLFRFASSIEFQMCFGRVSSIGRLISTTLENMMSIVTMGSVMVVNRAILILRITVTLLLVVSGIKNYSLRCQGHFLVHRLPWLDCTGYLV